MIKDKLTDQLKLFYGLWTREAVAELILNRYGIALSRWQVGRYLKQWLETKYPSNKKRAAKENVVIYFGDETGMRSDHQAGRVVPQRRNTRYEKTGQRFSLNMISAISNKGHLQFMMIDGRFNSEVFEAFFKQMIKYSKQKIYFVTDGHPAHKIKKLNEWLQANKARIEVFFSSSIQPRTKPSGVC